MVASLPPPPPYRNQTERLLMLVVCQECGHSGTVKASQVRPNKRLTCKQCGGAGRIVESTKKPKKAALKKASITKTGGGYKSVGATKRAISASRKQRAEKTEVAHRVSGLGNVVVRVVSGGAVRPK